MEDLSLVVTLVLALGMATLGGLVARRVGQPALLGYILAGVLLGPNTPGLAADRDRVALLANLGVAFLMFALGVEFSLEELMRVRRVALLAGGLQIVLTLMFGTIVGVAIGWPPAAAMLLGAAFAISSSIVAIKLLTGRGEVERPHGRIAFGIGVVQDLSVVPLLALLPLLSGSADNLPAALARSLGTAAVALVVALAVGMRLVPRVLFALARSGSRELFLMTVVVIALGAGLASQAAGLSFALGAFLAGIVVSESEFGGQVLAEVIPLRDLFATIFFVAVGMLVDPPFLRAHAGLVLALVGALVAGKLILTGSALRVAGVDVRVAVPAAATLAQMGEFSFVLAGIGMTAGIIGSDQYGVILAVALGSIVAAPSLLHFAPRLADLTARLTRAGVPPQPDDLDPAAAATPREVVICGHRKVGAEIGRMLRHVGVPYAVIDLNPAVVRRLRGRGAFAVYGDAAAPPVLERAGVVGAKVLAIAIPDLVTATAAVREARRLNPAIRVIALAGTPRAVPALEAAGVDQVVQPEFEAALGIGRQALRWVGLAAADARSIVSDQRRHIYDRDRAAAAAAPAHFQPSPANPEPTSAPST
ncbi:MAG: cation:proton antiporter [Thermomicrobiales bacterium]|nr:cation:proton antiporter [Thermomicrobiales bacterium]